MSHNEETTPAATTSRVALTRRELREQRERQTSNARASVSDLTTNPPASVASDLSAGGSPLSAGSDAPTILTVCTGNICRSALAEVLLRARLADQNIIVHSAGTRALVGHGMPAEAQELATRNGGEAAAAEAHQGRLLTEGLLKDADLVLTMTAEHNTFAVQLAPSKLRSVFSLRAFARLASSLSDDEILAAADQGGENARERLQSVVRAVAGRRGMVVPGDDDVVDPFRRPMEVYEESAAQIVPALDQVERAIRAAVSARVG